MAGQGYWGRVLDIDLTTRDIAHTEVPDAVYERFLGGVGLGAYLLWERIPVGADPLGPDNVLGLVPGLLTDTGSLFTGRWLVVAKSPATGGWGDANAGGHFSPFLKRSKVDGVFFRGQSDTPVYLRLDEDGAELLDASDLWGLDAVETEDRLRERHGKRCQVACIGPAGENLSILAGIVNDRGRIAARSGLGAVMGSKKLKAVVAMGRSRIGVANKDELKRLTKEYKARIPTASPLNRVLGDTLLGMVGVINRVSPVVTKQPADLWRLILARFGTPGLTAMSAEGGDSPVKNWVGVAKVDFPLKRAQHIGAEAVVRHEFKKYGCYSCPLRCGGLITVQDGPYPLAESHKPEYETLCAFGTMTLVDDLPVLLKINDLCNRGGIDSISTGAAIAFAIECHERGLLSAEQVDGLDLRWGHAQAVLELTRRIIAREGLGDLLANGVKRAAETMGAGATDAAIHAGGVELPMHDPKFDPGFIATYTCEPTPGRHTISSLQYAELQELDQKYTRMPRLAMATRKGSRNRATGKGEILAVGSFHKMLLDAGGVCLFGSQAGGNMPLTEWMNAATGWSHSADEYLRIGERIHQLRHAFNVREGINPIRDNPPHPRTYGEPPQTAGPFKGLTLDAEAWIREYYRSMHWSVETGRADRAHLEALGLPEALD